MWQVLLGIYLVVGALSALLLWAALVSARGADQSTKNVTGPRVGLNGRARNDPMDSQVIQFPQVHELSKK